VRPYGFDGHEPRSKARASRKLGKLFASPRAGRAVEADQNAGASGTPNPVSHRREVRGAGRRRRAAGRFFSKAEAAALIAFTDQPGKRNRQQPSVRNRRSKAVARRQRTRRNALCFRRRLGPPQATNQLHTANAPQPAAYAAALDAYSAPRRKCVAFSGSRPVLLKRLTGKRAETEETLSRSRYQTECGKCDEKSAWRPGEEVIRLPARRLQAQSATTMARCGLNTSSLQHSSTDRRLPLAGHAQIGRREKTVLPCRRHSTAHGKAGRLATCRASQR
jgi:hypothetical protein